MYEWIKSFLENRTQKVIVDGKQSTNRPVLSGVPQGTVMGPLLFLIYINDMSKGLDAATKLRLFADDSLLYRVIKTDEDQMKLQEDLNKLQQWESTWKMEFHPKKCQVIRITNKIHKKVHTYNIHGIQLEETDSAKYLGITIDNKMNWNTHINNICNKANATLGFLRRNIYMCPPKVKEKCYEVYVRPTLEYCGSVWDPHTKSNIDKIERIQRRAARFVLNDYNYENNNNQNLRNLEWIPLEERRAKNKVKLLFKAQSDLLSIPLNHLKRNNRSTRLKSNSSYQVPASRVDSHLHSFYPSTIRLWDKVPESLKSLNSVDNFAKSLEGVTLRTHY